MSKATDRAKALLDSVEGRFPVHLNEMTLPSDDEVIGTLRKPDGYPIVMPHPESMSMLVGERVVFDFITDSYEVIQGLLDELAKKSPNSGESGQNQG